jgi:hypothetical protein
MGRVVLDGERGSVGGRGPEKNKNKIKGEGARIE